MTQKRPQPLLTERSDSILSFFWAKAGPSDTHGKGDLTTAVMRLTEVVAAELAGIREAIDRQGDRVVEAINRHP